MRWLRRYEILLPLKYNEGTPVEREKFQATWKELVQHFGGVTVETQVLKGFWRHEAVDYEDELLRVVVDAPDTPEAGAFFREWKETLKERFRQIDLWITSHAIEVV
jgi:hypothetical protein